jgi:hypothetical protein
MIQFLFPILLMIFPIAAEAATLREKFTSGAAKIYSKILGKKPTEKLCQDIFSTQLPISDSISYAGLSSSDDLNTKPYSPRISNELIQATTTYLKLYNTHKDQDLTPQVINQAFHQMVQQAIQEGFTQKEFMIYKKKFIDENYADLFFQDQTQQTFAFLDDFITSNGEHHDAIPSGIHVPFSINKMNSSSLHKKTTTISSEMPNIVFYTRIKEIFRSLNDLLISLYGIDPVDWILDFSVRDCLHMRQHSSIHPEIYEGEHIHPKKNTSKKETPKLWIVGNTTNNQLIASAKLKDTILRWKKHGGYSGDSLYLSDTRFYFHLNDQNKNQFVFVYLFHTPFGLQLGQSTLDVHHEKEVWKLPFVSMKTRHLNSLLQNLRAWLLQYNSIFFDFKDSFQYFRSPESNANESRSIHYYDPERRKIYLLFFPYNYVQKSFLKSQKIVRFLEIPLGDGPITDIELPEIHADENDSIHYRGNTAILRHLQSDFFEFELNYNVQQPNIDSVKYITQKIQLFRRSSIGPPVPPTESE